MDGPALHTRTEAREPWDGRDSRRLLGFVLAYVATRLLWLVMNPEPASYWEESYRWLSAHELLEGPLYPLFEYQADHYQGGPLVVILMAVPLFAVFGESALVLKLVAVCFAVAVLCALYFLMRANFGRTAAWVAGVVYLCGPPLVAHSSLVTMGSHGESTLFSLVQLSLLFGMLTGRWRTEAAWAVFGLTSGIGLWFCYTSGLSLATCGLVWLLIQGVPRPREIAAALAGTVVGLAPWFAYNVGRDFIGLTRILELFGYADPVEAWAEQGALEKLGLLVGRDLATGILYPYGPPLAAPLRALGQLAYFVPLLIAGAIGLVRVLAPQVRWPALAPLLERRGEYRLELAFFVYGAVFLGVFMASDITIEWENAAHAYRILLPAIVLLAIPPIITLARAIDAGGRLRVIAIAGLAVSMLASTLGTIRLATYQPVVPQVIRLEVGDIVRGILLQRKWESDLDVAIVAARLVPERDRRTRTFRGIGWGIEFRHEKSGEIRDVLLSVEKYDLEERRGLVQGIHWALKRGIPRLRKLVNQGRATPQHAEKLERLRRLQSVLTQPETWYRLTGEDKPPRRIR
jgi:hypothetical protein